MKKSIQVSVSILCADFNKLGDEIKKCEDAGVDIIHIDVMDGHFVPNITIGPIIVESVKKITKLPIDAHLMIEHPSKYINDFIQAGADIISIHAECYGQRRPSCQSWDAYPKETDVLNPSLIIEDIHRIKKEGVKAFVVLNPGTPIVIEPVLHQIDGVLIMSVNPGFAKQKFMPQVLTKIEDLRSKMRFTGDIAIDGGVNAETAPQAVKAGVNILATASYFFGAKNSKEAVMYLKNIKA